MMIFIMQNVDQMMESLSWYVLLQIKLNKYIKINMYWTKKKYLQKKKILQDILYIILLISFIRISTVLSKENYDWLPA